MPFRKYQASRMMCARDEDAMLVIHSDGHVDMYTHTDGGHWTSKVLYNHPYRGYRGIEREWHLEFVTRAVKR